MSHLLLIGFALSLAALFVCCWLDWQLLRQNGRMLLRFDELEKRLHELEFGGAEKPMGLPLSSAAPDFNLPDLAGKRHTLAEYRGHPVLLIFFNPACGFCRELLPKISALPQAAPGAEPVRDGGRQSLVEIPRLLIISTGGVDANRQLFEDHKVACMVLLQNVSEVISTYLANGTPGGYLVDSEGNIASELAVGADALLALASGQRSQPPTPNIHPNGSGNGDGRENRFGSHSLARSKIKRDGLTVGALAPDFRLPRLDGTGQLALQELRGKSVLLIFSSPHCGPCNTLAPRLEKFHRNHPEWELVMISRGEPAENRAKLKEHHLSFTVLLQQQWEVSRQYAMFATPVAYLIDERGIISAEVAVGADAIVGLLAKINLSVPQSEHTAVAILV
jgi:peroxiredoxin